MKRMRLAPWDIFWLTLAALYFLVPLFGTTEFSLETGPGKHGFDAYRTILGQQDFRDTFLLSIKIAIGTVIASMVLMVPTAYWVHLKMPRLRPVLDFVAILPFVVPPVTLAVGILQLFQAASQQKAGPLDLLIARTASWMISGPQILAFSYVILAMPFTYRALDAGLRAIDVRILTEAAQSLGANWFVVMLRVILPNLRFAMLSAAFLTITLVVGEYTMASLMLFNTFATYLYEIGNSQAQQSAALAVISLVLTWAALLAILVLGRGGRSRQTAVTGAR